MFQQRGEDYGVRRCRIQPVAKYTKLMIAMGKWLPDRRLDRMTTRTTLG